MVPHTQQASPCGSATSLLLLLCLVVPIHADSEYPTLKYTQHFFYRFMTVTVYLCVSASMILKMKSVRVGISCCLKRQTQPSLLKWLVFYITVSVKKKKNGCQVLFSFKHIYGILVSSISKTWQEWFGEIWMSGIWEMQSPLCCFCNNVQGRIFQIHINLLCLEGPTQVLMNVICFASHLCSLISASW